MNDLTMTRAYVIRDSSMHDAVLPEGCRFVAISRAGPPIELPMDSYGGYMLSFDGTTPEAFPVLLVAVKKAHVAAFLQMPQAMIDTFMNGLDEFEAARIDQEQVPKVLQ